MMVPSSKSPLASDTESVCLLLLISFLIHRWAWRMRKNWKQIGGFQENETLCFIISNPHPRANFLGIVFLCIPWYTFVMGPSLYDCQRDQNFSISQAFLPFVKKISCFSCWLCIHSMMQFWNFHLTSALAYFYAALAFKNFCDSKQRNSSI